MDGSAPSTLADLPKSMVAGLWLAEDPAALASVAVDQYVAEKRTITVFAAHITALNLAGDASFRDTFNRADAAHADGISWTIVAGFGGQVAHKAATSDLALVVVNELASRLRRPVNIAVIGGSPDSGDRGQMVAERAAAALERMSMARTVYATHGFHRDWEPVLSALRTSMPDVLLVGMGMPQEAAWTIEHVDHLPPSLTITCGGWLRILAGDEVRAPVWARRLQLEWAHRLLTDPARTGRRYADGVLNVSQQALRGVAQRHSRRARRISRAP